MRFHIWYNGSSPENSRHNWRYDSQYEQALVPQNKAMNDAHIDQLVNEWLFRHNPPAHILNNPPAMQAWRVGAKNKAREWAIKNEPKRFLNPLLRSMNGIPADRTMRRNRAGNTAILSSSWVGDAKVDVTGTQVNIDLGGKSYRYGLAGPEGLKNFGSSESLGRVISQLSRMPAGSTLNGLVKLWDSRAKG